MTVKKTTLPIWWEEAEAYPINHALWNTTYQPYAEAKLAYVENDAVYINMFVEEQNPKAVYTKMNDPVYKDSCLECFINFDPLHQDNYLNIEVNANGAMLMGYGKDRHERQSVICEEILVPFKNEKGWGFTLILSVDFIRQYFHQIADTWLCNFYKCGDECASPHFLSWSEVKEEHPNFHCSKWFGKIEVVESA